jgi:septum formation protein
VRSPKPFADRTRFVLASASPARRSLLEAAGVTPEIVVSGVDESIADESDPDRLCVRLARLKATAVAASLNSTRSAPTTVVLGCDSVLAFEGAVFGKPVDAPDATRRWQAMRGRRGVLHTGHCLIDVAARRRAEEASRTGVQFADVSDAEIASYVRTGEPLAVAGGFTIDGLGGWFVERLDGDHGTVVGLSLPLLRRLLAQLGLSVSAFWATD